MAQPLDAELVVFPDEPYAFRRDDGPEAWPRARAAFVSGRLNVDIRNALRRVRHPMLILWGGQARMNSVQNAHAFRVLKPDAEWVLVADAGDLPHDEQPKKTTEASPICFATWPS